MARNVAEVQKPLTRPWTVLVYMVADDPAGGELLDQTANRELEQIIFSTLSLQPQDLYVAVQVDFRSQPDVWRRVIGEGAWRQPETNAASPETLYGFFSWAKEQCPAERYLLMFWGHSRGPFGLFTDSSPWVYEAQTLTLNELGDTLQMAKECLAQPIEIVVFKDCFMSTLETVVELNERAGFMIGSQARVPIHGWPYLRMLQSLDRRPSSQIAETIGRELQQHYQCARNRRDGDVEFDDVPISVLDIRAASSVAVPLKEITEALTKPSSGAHARSRRVTLNALVATPGEPALLDVSALCRDLRARKLAPEYIICNLEEAVRRIVLAALPANPKFALRFGGVSLFRYPLSNVAATKSAIAGNSSRTAYLELALVKQTQWDLVALQGMPAPPPTRTESAWSKGAVTPYGMWDVVLGYVQRLGILEQLERQGLDGARRSLGAMARAGFSKEAGFGPEFISKEAGFTAAVMGNDSILKSGFARRVSAAEAAPAAEPRQDKSARRLRQRVA